MYQHIQANKWKRRNKKKKKKHKKLHIQLWFCRLIFHKISNLNFVAYKNLIEINLAYFKNHKMISNICKNSVVFFVFYYFYFQLFSHKFEPIPCLFGYMFIYAVILNTLDITHMKHYKVWFIPFKFDVFRVSGTNLHMSIVKIHIQTK